MQHLVLWGGLNEAIFNVLGLMVLSTPARNALAMLFHNKRLHNNFTLTKTNLGEL
jgi:hypothetical protein